MKRNEGNNTVVVVTALMLSLFLVYISSASGQNALQSMRHWIKQSVTMQARPYLSCSIDATGRLVENPAGENGLSY